MDDEIDQLTPPATFISSLKMQRMVVIEADCSTKLHLPPVNSLAERTICDLQAIFGVQIDSNLRLKAGN